MNSKEVLENLTYCVNGMERKEKYYKIIKQELDRLEELEEERANYDQEKDTINALTQENTKLKKVIEMLKDKFIFEINFYEENNEKHYYIALYNKNDKSYLERIKISKEQYELLKEVFENE